MRSDFSSNNKNSNRFFGVGVIGVIHHMWDIS